MVTTLNCIYVNSFMDQKKMVASIFDLYSKAINGSRRGSKDGMVSIPRTGRELGTVYRQGSQPNLLTSPASSPTSPYSWEESLSQLSRDLQVICRSPDIGDGSLGSSDPSSPGRSPGPASPTAELTRSACSSSDVKHLQVRHLQSEQKLSEKLQHICHSPRRKLKASPLEGDTFDEDKLSSSLPGIGRGDYACKAPRCCNRVGKSHRKYSQASHSGSSPPFKKNLNIGHYTVEDLNVIIEDRKVKVFLKPQGNVDSARASPEPPLSEGTELLTSSMSPVKRPVFPIILQLPTSVNPVDLICIVRKGVLEVREGKKQTSTQRLLSSLDLKRSISVPDPTNPKVSAYHHNIEQTPIVIEDEGSHHLKLVLPIPQGFNFADLKIKTVNERLIVCGRKNEGDVRPQSMSDAELGKAATRPNSEREFFKVFELPQSVDPYSMTARLTDENKLIIQAVLSVRCRCKSL